MGLVFGPRDAKRGKYMDAKRGKYMDAKRGKDIDPGYWCQAWQVYWGPPFFCLSNQGAKKLLRLKKFSLKRNKIAAR